MEMNWKMNLQVVVQRKNLLGGNPAWLFSAQLEKDRKKLASYVTQGQLILNTVDPNLSKDCSGNLLNLNQPNTKRVVKSITNHCRLNLTTLVMLPTLWAHRTDEFLLSTLSENAPFNRIKCKKLVSYRIHQLDLPFVNILKLPFFLKK